MSRVPPSHPVPRAPRVRTAAVLLAAALGAGLGVPAPARAADDLMRVLALALQNDPEYQAAGAANRAAQEGPPQARAALMPLVSGVANVSGTSAVVKRGGGSTLGAGSRGFHSTTLELDVRQPLYHKDLWIALDQADSRVRQANAQYAASRQDLMVRAAEAYFGVLRAVEQLRFARAAQEAFGQQLKQSEQRFEVGLIAITDVEEAKSGYDLARSDVIAAENAIDTAHEALRAITGRYEAELAPLGDGMPLVNPQPADIDRWTTTALEQNLSVAAARYAAETAREEIQRVEAGHLPKLDIVGSHSRFHSNGGLSGASEDWSTSLGLELNVPIYQGGEVLSQTRQSREQYQQALDGLEFQRRTTQRDTRNAYLGVESGISKVQALQQAVRSTKAAVEAVEAGFQVGTRTSVDVLNAQRDLFRARNDLAGARFDYILDVLRLKKAAGTLSEDDLALVNHWLKK